MKKVIEKIKRVYKKRKPKDLSQEQPDSKKELDKPALPPSSVILGIQ
ncbi:MAG: hypothetical protein PHW12_00190 [Smithella sp.]|jgi:hypothetical protein|nr:hypothetical protein [Smithella sp.]